MPVRSFGLSDLGQYRELNEDSYLCDDELQLWVVADGVGGGASGEVASSEAVQLVQSWVLRSRPVIEKYLADPNDETRRFVRRMFEAAVQSACYMLFGMGDLEPEQYGMSTTLSGLLIAGEDAFVAQVGDSRVYRLRAGVVEQLTEDHTLINYRLKHGLITPEEAARASGKNVITRAVGHRDYVEVDTFCYDAQVEDRYILCSDGLHGYLGPGDLERLVPGSLDDAAERLIAHANESGGSDNITVVLVEIY